MDLAVNGNPDVPLNEREDFDPAVHQALLDEMKAGNLSLVFLEQILEVEGWEDEAPEDPVWTDWVDNVVVVCSDGEKFLVTIDMP